MQKPVLFSFFSGSGFLDLGFENSGFDVAFVNEFHTPFLDAYKYTRKVMNHDEPRFGYSSLSIEALLDGEEGEHFSSLVKKAKTSDNLVGFIGGPPCPDFSVGGKNKGSEGENGKLTRTYVDLIVKDSPDYFIFENVKGLWRTKRHREFYESMKIKLQEAGYELTDRLTNSIEYGVPQDRDRIFLFGIKSKYVEKHIEGSDLESIFNWNAKITVDIKSVMNKSRWPSVNQFVEDEHTDYTKFIDEELKQLTIQHWFDKNDVLNHPNAKHHFQPKSEKFAVIEEGDDSKKSFKRLHRWRYSPTAAYGNNEVHLHPYKARRISAAEALAIQSLPKEFYFPATMTLSNMFKTIGNGVPYLAAKGLAETTFNFLEFYIQDSKYS
ncbi:DNA cytosine methyltransferase [Thalassotalea sp. 1_MG-2023]|uniref:DNA cytosine methyltransferase n=1 Tax=Thalassotalea sp. 1_MG-2023 TaxID=3062680 RepID=UPI0026E3BEA2|nr:DNA cytosine methyltransferase [Thalassotalea sp. 1_MG-2023]MDO6428629.1 DNA cytosine methyltransferase [Thalassotalea sp. 1_MG-2023]